MKKKFAIATSLLIIFTIFLASFAAAEPNFKVHISDFWTDNKEEQGQTVQVGLEVVNEGDDGTMRIECGVYQKKLIEDWGIPTNNYFAWILFPWKMDDVQNCNSNEDNVDTESLTLTRGEHIKAEDLRFRPKAPFSNADEEYVIFCDAYHKCYDEAGIKEVGEACARHSDCQTSYCVKGVCSSGRVSSYDLTKFDLVGTSDTETCADGIRNQDESDTDCGGIKCDNCKNGFMCNSNQDCENNFCNPDTRRCEPPRCTKSCEPGQAQNPYPDCKCVAQTRACTNTCSELQKPYPDCTCYPFEGNGGTIGTPIIYSYARNVNVDGNIIRAWIGLQNNGDGDMSKPWIIEMQIRPHGTQPLAWVGQQATCDPNTPENVHKEFQMKAGETTDLTLESVLAPGKYDVFLISVDKCYASLPVGNAKVLPFGAGTFIKTVTVEKGAIACDGFFCEKKELKILIILLVLVLAALIGYFIYIKRQKP